jgi:hypothetical protein
MEGGRRASKVGTARLAEDPATDERGTPVTYYPSI